MLSALLILSYLSQTIHGCEQLLLKSGYTFLDDIFTLTGDFVNGRPMYSSNNRDPKRNQYLYHVYHDNHARWIIGDSTDKATGWAFTTTWAVYPTDDMVQAVSPGTQWRVSNNASGWEEPEDFSVTCRNGDDRAIFVSSSKIPHLHGIWVINKFDTNVWRRIDSDIFIFREETGANNWLIGTKYSANESLFIIASNDDDAASPLLIRKEWMVDIEGKKSAEHITIFNAFDEQSKPNLMKKIRNHYQLHPNNYQTEGGRNPDGDYIELNNGLRMPKLGYGTGGLSGGKKIESLLTEAVRMGYQLFDSAEAYESEEPIAKLLNESVVAREDIWVTTKVWPTNLGFRPTVRSVDESLKRLNTPYINLYLIHWPECYDHFEWMDCTHASGGSWQETWSVMEKFYAEGVFLAIGVSNFNLPLLDELRREFSVSPQVIQNLWTLQHRETGILEYCTNAKIAFQAYASYRNLAENEDDAWNTVLERMGRRIKRSRAQIVNRWIIDQGMAVIPRSSKPAHMKENLDCLKFSLPEKELSLLNDNNEAPKTEM